MAYEQRPLRRQKVRYNSANADWPLTWQLIVDGAKVTPSAAPTITIYRPGNSTALVSAADMTLTSSVATYSPDTTTVASWPKDTGYRAEIAATYNSTAYVAVLMFDVVTYPLRLTVAWDQLVARDERIAAMSHNGDEDFSPIIEATRDEMLAIIESRVIEDQKMVESMILDESQASIPFRLLVLANIWQNKGETDLSQEYRQLFSDAWRVASAAIQYDDDQDGEESADVGRVAIQLQY